MRRASTLPTTPRRRGPETNLSLTVYRNDEVIGWTYPAGCANAACIAARANGKPWHATPRDGTLASTHFATADEAVAALEAHDGGQHHAMHTDTEEPAMNTDDPCARYDALAAQFTRGQILAWTPLAWNAKGDGTESRHHKLVQYLNQTDASETAHVRLVSYPGSGVEVEPVLGDVHVARLDELHAETAEEHYTRTCTGDAGR